VLVIFEEDAFDEDFNKLRVLRVNFPLFGKIPLNYYNSIAKQASIDVKTLNARSLPEHQALLCRLTMPPAAAAALPHFSAAQCLANLAVNPAASPTASSSSSSAAASSSPLPAYPGLPPIFASLSRFITSFNTAYVLVKGFVDHAGGKIKDACERLHQELVQHAAQTEGVGKLSRVASMEATAAIEACVFAGVWRKVWSGLVDLHRAEEARTQALLASAITTSMQELGVRAELVCEPTQAVQHLQQALNAPTAVTPLHKLAVLEDTNKLLTQAVDAKLAAARAKKSGTDKSQQDATLAADDMLPFWIFLLVHAKPAHVHANMLFMQHFQPNSSFINTQQLKVHLANLQGAVQFVDAGQIGVARGGPGAAAAVGMSFAGGPPPGPRRTRSTSTIVTNSFADLSVRDAPGQGQQGGSAAAATSSSSSTPYTYSFNSRNARQHFAVGGIGGEGSQLLASIEDEYAELQEQLHRQQHQPQQQSAPPPPSARQLSVSTHTSRSNSPNQGRSRTMTHSMTVGNGSSNGTQGSLARQSSLQLPYARNELPSTRARSPQPAPSPAVAAVAAGSVGRMGQFLAGLQQQDDGATGRLVPGTTAAAAGGANNVMQVRPPHSTRASTLTHQQGLLLSRRATGPIPSSARNSNSNSSSMLQSSPAVLRLDDDDLPPLIVQRTSSTSARRF
jgi:hypothetical protein